jgi:hypothetical protein
MRDDATTEPDPIRPGALVGLAILGVALGPALGALTNAVNGRVSPEYFRAVMRWDEIRDVGRAAIAQGVFEGLLFGVALSLIFVVVVGVSSRARCPLRISSRYLAAIAATALACWAIGGLLAIGLATLSPEFYRHAFRGVPDDPSALLRYAWVGGSITGLQWGGFAAVVLASVLFTARWRSRGEARGAAPPEPRDA